MQRGRSGTTLILQKIKIIHIVRSVPKRTAWLARNFVGDYYNKIVKIAVFFAKKEVSRSWPEGPKYPVQFAMP